MRSNNELQMMNELIHYMGVQSAMQGKKKKKKKIQMHSPYSLLLLSFSTLSIPTDF